jgi:hypothetical protein
MQNFVDLAGASGATYRFHRVGDLSQLPAIAGNFVYVRGLPEDMNVICCGTDETLLNADRQWPSAVQEHQAEALFVRLNVSWKVRSHEHDDIVGRYAPKMIVASEFDRLLAQ